MPYTLPKTPASIVHEVTGASSVMIFVPKIPLDDTTLSPRVPKAVGVLCTLRGSANIPLTPLYEAVIKGIGKVDSTIRSKELKVDPFTVQIQAGDMRTLLTLLGYDHTSSTNNSPELRGNYGVSGHLIINFHNTSTTAHRGSVLLLNVEARIPSLPALEADSSTTFEVEFQCATARVHVAKAGKPFAVEFWKSPDAQAPDGTITAFVLGTGNGAYASSTTPVALQIESADATRTGYRQYFHFLNHNGTEVAESLATFNAGTSTLTFGTAPTAGFLSAIYQVDSAVTVPCNTDQPDRRDSLRYPWQDYPNAES